jgi:hypothetical protein
MYNCLEDWFPYPYIFIMKIEVQSQNLTPATQVIPKGTAHREKCLHMFLIFRYFH